MFPQNQVNAMISNKLKEIKQLKNIELNELDYATKNRKYFDFSEYSLPSVFLGDINEGNYQQKILIDGEVNYFVN